MHVGVDFDNTIIRYDELFYSIALEKRLIPPSVLPSKKAIRDYLWSLTDGNKLWTELQGVVYGPRIHGAAINEGFNEFVFFCRKNRIQVSIISHKTQYPAVGEKYDLRHAALKWLIDKKMVGNNGIARSNIYFEDNRKEKINRIKAISCTHFIDDLTEVFDDAEFPPNVKKFLFSLEKGALSDVDSGDWFDALRWIRRDVENEI